MYNIIMPTKNKSYSISIQNVLYHKNVGSNIKETKNIAIGALVFHC